MTGIPPTILHQILIVLTHRQRAQWYSPYNIVLASMHTHGAACLKAGSTLHVSFALQVRGAEPIKLVRRCHNKLIDVIVCYYI